MAQANSSQEYMAKFYTNQRIEGFGHDKVTMHVPCPFCAEPDFMVYKIIEVEQALQKGGTCSHCHRSAKALLQRADTGVQFEIVQTGGDQPAEWLTPMMGRV